MDILGKLFGSAHRVKILRLFLLNPETLFDGDTISRRSKVPLKEAKKELLMLAEVRLIRHKSLTRSESNENEEKSAQKDLKKGWQLDRQFPLIDPLRLLLLYTVPFTREEVVQRLRRVGKLKLIVTAGIFIQQDDSRTDLLIVGDDIKRSALEHAIRAMEAEIGRELNYGVFETQDFHYRYGVYDKFIRDVLDYPHDKIVDKIGL